jgi:ABC-type microcin C transport system permease subunit YejB
MYWLSHSSCNFRVFVSKPLGLDSLLLSTLFDVDGNEDDGNDVDEDDDGPVVVVLSSSLVFLSFEMPAFILTTVLVLLFPLSLIVVSSIVINS